MMFVPVGSSRSFFQSELVEAISGIAYMSRPLRMGLLLGQRCGVAFAQDTQDLLMQQAV
jgi:hypothetical protein